MVDLPDQYVLHLRENTFKTMKNLKILIIKSARISGTPKYLPNNLRLLDWMEYPSTSLPSNFHPKKLVVLNLSRSRFSMKEPFKVYIHTYIYIWSLILLFTFTIMFDFFSSKFVPNAD